MIFSTFKNSIDYAIDWGALPGVVLDQKHTKETLATYVETYLREELVQEDLLRKLDPFVRFLSVARACAGLLNDELDSSYRGFLFETLLINQVRAYNSYSKKIEPFRFIRFLVAMKSI